MSSDLLHASQVLADLRAGFDRQACVYYNRIQSCRFYTVYNTSQPLHYITYMIVSRPKILIGDNLERFEAASGLCEICEGGLE